MSRWIWIDIAVVLAVHDEQLAEHGGSPGMRDRGLLESALARPKNLGAYEPEADIAALAVAYAYGIVRNHPFIDGNKRTGFVALELFLELNGQELRADDAACVETILRLAEGALSEVELVQWARASLASRSTQAR
jgi:death on curing protein